MNCKWKSRRRFFLLMRSRTPPISSEFRGGGGGGLNTPNPPSVRHWFSVETAIRCEGAIGRNMCWGQGADRVDLNGRLPWEEVQDWLTSHQEHLFLAEFLRTVEFDAQQTSDVPRATTQFQPVTAVNKASYCSFANFRRSATPSNAANLLRHSDRWHAPKKLPKHLSAITTIQNRRVGQHLHCTYTVPHSVIRCTLVSTKIHRPEIF